MDLVRFKSSEGTLVFMDLDGINKAFVEPTKEGNKLCYTEKGQSEIQEIPPCCGAERIIKALTLKSRLLPDANKEFKT